MFSSCFFQIAPNFSISLFSVCFSISFLTFQSSNPTNINVGSTTNSKNPGTDLINEANQKIDAEKIKDIKKRIERQKTLQEDKKLQEFEDKIKKLEQEIINKKNEIGRENNKKQKFEEKQKQIILDIKEKAGKSLNVAIEI